MSEAKRIGGWPKLTGRGHPGEPLYTLDEVAERLGVSPGALHVSISQFPGLVPWQRAVGSSFSRQRHLYRMSDAKEWWAKVGPSAKA